MMEELVLVHKTQIKKTVEALLQYAEKQKKNDLVLAIESEPINLQLCLKKIPNTKNKIIKISVPHTLVQDTSDICLFVKDLDKTERDSDPTTRHFKELLSKKGVKQNLEVIPLKALKLEYQPYEAKKNLSNMFDVYLTDDRIAHLLPTILGKHFISRKKFPVQVNLKAADLKKEIDKALSLQQCVLTGKGPMCQVTVAHTQMTVEKITRNIEVVLAKLAQSIPGGAPNVKNLHVKMTDSPALPLYASFDDIDDIKFPPRKKMSEETEAEEVSTVSNALVKITRSGRVMVVRTPRLESDETPKKRPARNAKKSVRGKKRKQTDKEAVPVSQSPRKKRILTKEKRKTPKTQSAKRQKI